MNAAYVAILAALVATTAFAGCVIAWFRTSRLASKVRSTTYLQGELIEIRDYVSKIDAWAKRISQREVMRERRGDKSINAPAAQRSLAGFSTSEGMSKDELRRFAGLKAGLPAPHHEEH
jgi:hypothetical protein